MSATTVRTVPTATTERVRVFNRRRQPWSPQADENALQPLTALPLLTTTWMSLRSDKYTWQNLVGLCAAVPKVSDFLTRFSPHLLSLDL